MIRKNEPEGNKKPACLKNENCTMPEPTCIQTLFYLTKFRIY